MNLPGVQSDAVCFPPFHGFRREVYAVPIPFSCPSCRACFRLKDDRAGQMWTDPNQPPAEVKGTVERRWIMGGRFVQEAVNIECNGQRFEGLGVLGYDRAQKQYTTTRVCGLCGKVSQGLSSCDASGKKFTCATEECCPLTGQKVKGRDEVILESKDRIVTNVYKTINGQEMKVLEFVSIRRLHLDAGRGQARHLPGLACLFSTRASTPAAVRTSRCGTARPCRLLRIDALFRGRDQFREHPPAADQFLIRPHLDNPPLVEDQDAVGAAQRAQPVGDEDRGAVGIAHSQGALHQPLADVVQRRRRLVENQDR
jgi:hypothetical protein